jgi:hypothetical protein
LVGSMVIRSSEVAMLPSLVPTVYLCLLNFQR